MAPSVDRTPHLWVSMLEFYTRATGTLPSPAKPPVNPTRTPAVAGPHQPLPTRE